MTESFALYEFTENAYLNYSMYVIMDRALPFIGDGLKPVQRRIIYAMFELGLHANSKFKKSARTIGDVLGKYHPHGDSACYEAMVLMAQSFSYRYPLIDGQGNWGVLDDPKSFAAMRYTESRLSKYAELLLDELHCGTIDWIPNFDGTLQEPKMLPARLPNILLNGTTGIAVGMSTDIPPHNLHEIAQALITLIEKPNSTIDDLLNIIHGPDYPTEAEIITSRNDMRKIYQSGRGSIRMRSLWKKENNIIIITALPYQVSCARVMEQIANQMYNKKLPMINDLRDESDQNNQTRLVIVFRTNRIDVEKIMDHLFITTDLEKSYRINLNMIGTNGRPAVKNLLEILIEWLEFRRDMVCRRLKHRMNKVINRIHILEGMLIAFFNIKEVINIIRNEEDPKNSLISYFGISNIQAESILELRLRYLIKLEEVKIKNEKSKLKKEYNQINSILSSKNKMNSLLKKELQNDANIYGNERRSILNEDENIVKTIMVNKYNLLTPELLTIVLSQHGWIRSAKGHDINVNELNYKPGDGFKLSVKCMSNQLLAFIDSSGRSYSIDPNTLLSSRGYGEPITNKLILPPGVKIKYMLSEQYDQKLLIASDAGYGFVCKFKNLISHRRTGKFLILLPKNSYIMKPLLFENENSMLLAITKNGRMLIFPIKELSELSKGKGNKIIHIPKEDVLTRKNILKHLLLPLSGAYTFYINQNNVKIGLKELQEVVGKRGCYGKSIYDLKHIRYIDTSFINALLS